MPPKAAKTGQPETLIRHHTNMDVRPSTLAVTLAGSVPRIDNFSYVLVTPAHNEEKYIRKTIDSVVGQRILPKRWIIVSDGSTDSTDDIVKEYVARHPWMELLRMPEHLDRTFSAKAHCVRVGYEKIKNVDFEIIGNLDADVSFDEDYFAFLLDKFAQDPDLGVAGSAFLEDLSKPYDYSYTNIQHVSGPCQLFRRRCFDEIGGYVPINGGGIDWVAVTTARMKGWKTRTFTEKKYFHHRRVGTATGGVLSVSFRYGQKDYSLGGHPLWEVFRCLYQMGRKPYFVGGLFLFLGFVSAFATGRERSVSRELMAFHRQEQMQRLRDACSAALQRVGVGLAR